MKNKQVIEQRLSNTKGRFLSLVAETTKTGRMTHLAKVVSVSPKYVTIWDRNRKQTYKYHKDSLLSA